MRGRRSKNLMAIEGTPHGSSVRLHIAVPRTLGKLEPVWKMPRTCIQGHGGLQHGLEKTVKGHAP